MNPLSALPQIETILSNPNVSNWIPGLSRPLVARIARETLDTIRSEFAASAVIPETAEVMNAVDLACESRYKHRLSRVINATGVIIHTNLGRSPMSTDLWHAAEPVNTGYTNLELDTETGKRGSRGGIVPELLALLTGAESGLVVNNGAAALYLILTTFAAGKKVIVSRGEQVQIGGGFRIPEILKFSGAELTEVGTTNVSTVDDYLAAVGENTAMALLVHTSNFTIKGFTTKPTPSSLRSKLADHVLLVVDQGSGATEEDIPDERKIREYLKDGADLVCFSTDKLLGGPQGGCIVGRKELIQTLSKHQLMRIVRPGKTVYSLLEEHLIAILNGSGQAIASARLSEDQSVIRRRCLAVRRALGADRVEVVPSTMVLGGGTAPESELQSWSIRIRGDYNPELILSKLRDRPAPIIATTKRGAIEMNLGTIEKSEITEIIDAILAIDKME